ncbi:serine/threonine-protein kinase 10 isoform X2 [Octopus bimaculoides]|uniref:serine/threonine-protein kinase 10 isoform X2 n=1 Tax=Octopus bimaculoides TaxID=37653 RepID=UPI0022E952B9|nr:serine/threonine-protein kinase 10 isoform X2 [Octopus bimaculoides]
MLWCQGAGILAVHLWRQIYLESRVRYIMEDVIPREGDVDIMKLAEETVLNARHKSHAKAETINNSTTMKDLTECPNQTPLQSASDEGGAGKCCKKEDMVPCESLTSPSRLPSKEPSTSPSTSPSQPPPSPPLPSVSPPPLPAVEEEPLCLEESLTSVSTQSEKSHTSVQTRDTNQSTSSMTDSFDSVSQSARCCKAEHELAALAVQKNEKTSSKTCHRNPSVKKSLSTQCTVKAQSKTPKSLQRNQSLDSCMSSTDCLSIASVVSPMPKYNISSRKRFEVGHAGHESPCDIYSYLTPTQRKDQQIKELKNQIKVMGKQMEEKERDIELLKSERGLETARIFEERTEQIQKVRDEMIELQVKNEQLVLDYSEAQECIKELQLEINEMKETVKKREDDQEKMYLEMYKKGQQSAQFEREEDLQTLLTRGVNNVGIRELARRLAWTECELAKWQTIQRREVYENADKPSTEAAATLRFLKDSFFHYLTNEKDSDDHLRAMIRIFNYTEVQKKKVAKNLLEGKKLRK